MARFDGLVILVLAATGLLLAGCATDYSKKPAPAIADATTVKDSAFDAQVRYTGPTLRTERRRGLFMDYHSVSLRSFVDKKSGQSTNQIYVVLSYVGGLRFYQTASFEGGVQRELLAIDRNVDFCNGGFCAYTETLGIQLTDAELESAVSGMKIRLNAKSGHESFIELPANYVAGFLAAVPTDRQ